jgi:hypothetical protein
MCTTGVWQARQQEAQDPGGDADGEWWYKLCTLESLWYVNCRTVPKCNLFLESLASHTELDLALGMMSSNDLLPAGGAHFPHSRRIDR